MIILKGVKDRIDVKAKAVIASDLGKDITVPFIVTIKKPTRSEKLELVERLTDKRDEDGEIVQARISDEELAREYVIDWRELPDAEGNQIEFSDDALMALVDCPEYNAALSAAIQEVVFGKKAALSKN